MQHFCLRLTSPAAAQWSFSGGWATLKVYFQLKKNKKEAKSAAVRDAEKIYSGWSKGSMASSKGLKVDRKEIQAEERNSSWQGRAGTGLVLLGRAAQNPIAGLGHKGREGSVHRHLKGGFGEGGSPEKGNG